MNDGGHIFEAGATIQGAQISASPPFIVTARDGRRKYSLARKH